VAIELFVAILVTRGGALSSLLTTERLTSTQWFLALAPAVVLFILWELGKLIARNRSRRQTPAEIASSAPAVTT